MVFSVQLMLLFAVGIVLARLLPGRNWAFVAVCSVFFAGFLLHVLAHVAFWRRIRRQGWDVPFRTFVFRRELIPGGRGVRIPPRDDCASLPFFEPMHDDLANLCDLLESMHGAARDFVEVHRTRRQDVARLAKFILQSEKCRPVALDEEVPGPFFLVRVPQENAQRAREILARRMPPVDLPQA